MLSIINTVFLPLTFLAGARAPAPPLRDRCPPVRALPAPPASAQRPATLSSARQTPLGAYAAATCPAPLHPPPPPKGVFGTNFTAITAYNWSEGFYFFWGVCAATTLVTVVLLRYWGMFGR
jgi:hypothetical protein